MNYPLAICSLFRDSMKWHGLEINQVHRYFKQIYEQLGINFGEVGFYLIEGNSSDNTREVLEDYAKKNANIHIFGQDATYNAVTSTEDDSRIKSLSRLGHRAIEEAKNNCEYVLFVESDLIMPAKTLIIGLFEGMLTQENPGVIAPIAMLDNQNVFYDTWGFRNLDGSRWTNQPPFSDVINKHERYIPMSSIGSCALIKSKILKDGANFYDGAFVEMCKQVKDRGYNIYADTGFTIRHPANQLVFGRWV